MFVGRLIARRVPRVARSSRGPQFRQKRRMQTCVPQLSHTHKPAFSVSQRQRQQDNIHPYHINTILLAEYEHQNKNRLRGLVGDFSGTWVDAGVKAPAVVFVDIFEKFGVPITMKEAREPMGNHKKVHIQRITEIPRVKDAWKRKYKRDPSPKDVDKMFKEFVPAQHAVLPRYAGFIPGAVETMAFIKQYFGVQIGNTTGFTRSMVDILLQEMVTQNPNFPLDFTVAADEVKNPRPAKDACLKNKDLMGISNSREVVKIGDTVMDIEEGKDAGMWTVGLVKYSNYVGMEPNDIEEMEKKDPVGLSKTYQHAARTLWNASPDYLVMEITDVPFVMQHINEMLTQGGIPKAGLTWKPSLPLHTIDIKRGTYHTQYKGSFDP